MIERKSEFLEKAKQVVISVMKTEGARMLFNSPVDPVALELHDYYDVITEPIDLGTIKKRLVDGKKSNWTTSHYKTAYQVFQDVRLVWTNCYNFNNGENDEPVRELCRKTEEYFNAKWKAAKLPLTEIHSEEEVTNEYYSIVKKSVELPIRFLDDFALRSTQTRGYFPLRDIQASNVLSIYATGVLLPVDETYSHEEEVFPVCLDNIVDWCFQYGEVPGIWIVTNKAWYKLMNPEESYMPYLSNTIARFMVTMAHLNFKVHEIPQCFKKFSNDALEDEDGMLLDDLVEILMENDSVREEALTLMKKRSRSPSSISNSIEKKKKCSSKNVQKMDVNSEANDVDLFVNSRTPSSVRGGGGDSDDTIHLSNLSTAPVPEKEEIKLKGKHKVLQGDDPDGISTRQHSRRKKCEKPNLKVKLGGGGNRSNRGVRNINEASDLEDDDPLFDPSNDTDSFIKDDEDDDYINEHKKSKSKKSNESESQKMKRERKALELSKVEKESDRRRGSPPILKVDFRIPQKLMGLALSCWDFFMTFRLILEIPSFPFWRFEAAISPVKNKKRHSSSSSKLHHTFRESHSSDAESLASGLLLHDIHTSLVKVLQGKIQLNKEASTLASLHSVKPSSGNWTQTVSLLLLKSPLEDVDDDTRKIASFLHSHEYLDLSVYAKLKILSTLINMVLALEAFHEHLNTLIDKQSVQKIHGYETKALNEEILESMELSLEEKAIQLSIGKWNDWFSSYRLGVMNTIGQDYRGAQYWILGAASGCYRIYVEQRLTYSRQCSFEGIEKEPELLGKTKGKGKMESGLIWGYYEGERIAELVDWLLAGDLESEKALLDALQNLPKPVRIEEQDLDDMDEDYEELINHKTMKIISVSYLNLTPSTLRKFQLDDYLSIKYPLLKGEGELPDSVVNVQLSSRIIAFVRSILATIPFWKKDAEIRSRICQAIDRVESVQGAMDLAKEVCNAIETHVLTPTQSIPRTSFDGMIHEVKCPLYFPRTSESIVVLKTGCLAHLDHYLEVSRKVLETPVTSQCFKESCHPNNIELTKTQVEALRPFEHFRVSCIAYRSPYPELPPEDSPLLEDKDIPVLPCMWMLLSSSSSSSNNNQSSLSLEATPAPLALPIHVDSSLPDFIVKVDAFEQSIQKNWKVGDRFKMFFGGKSTARSQAGGGYYKGTISQVATPISEESYDPWESLTVEWDNDHTGGSMKVSPWEIEVDPEEQRKLEEAQLRQLENQARYSRALSKAQRSEIYSEMIDGDEDVRSITDPDYDPLIDYDGDPHRGGRNRKRGSALDELVYYDPKNPSGPVPPEMMALLPGPRGFPVLIHNFVQRLKGKFKCPVFSGKDLDLYKVFHEVQSRGGYDRVTNLKLWKEVCRTLDVNLTGQTSASYNMRQNYEKCLLDFEHYLSFGKYSQDLENGCAPSLTELEPFPLKLRGEMESGDAMDVRPMDNKTPPYKELEQQMITRGAKRSKAAVLENLTMTQLLMGDGCLTDFPPSFPERSSERFLEGQKADWARLVSPLGDTGSSLVKGKSPLGWISTPSLTPVVVHTEEETGGGLKGTGCIVEVQPGESIGMALDRMGWALLGSTIWRRLPGVGLWYKTRVTQYNPQRHEFCLISDSGTDQEITEWIDLRELQSEELSQLDPESEDTSSPKEQPVSSVVAKSPVGPGRSELSNLLTPPPALHRFGTEESTRFHSSDHSLLPLLSSSQRPTTTGHSGVSPMGDLFTKVLNTGMSSELMKQLVDDTSEHRPIGLAPPTSTGGSFSSLLNSSSNQTPGGGVGGGMLSPMVNPRMKNLRSDFNFPNSFKK
eukprot:g5254.t1